ncbi:MAG: peptide ABC transporter substrate-binding protein [Candidatus Rokubacteria bacterium]|nr:peptide ABC transporter substrate-binding protein [Candidatus Rokubacteria bacterium]
MDEHEVREWIRRVKNGTLSRRHFIEAMMGLGLTAPMATQMLVSAGVARAQPKPVGFTPTRRGGGGRLRLLWWQAPTLLNGHFATGTKDQDASRPVYEPLAAFDPDGNFVPILAAEIPTHQNGGLSRDGKTVTWRLKKDARWHDGKPFTADDVIFTWEYAADPATAAVTVTAYRDIERIDRVDDHTVKAVFKEPRAFWYDAFFGVRGYILPRHLFSAYKGANSRNAPQNLKPIGTGPYKLVDFKPGDSARYEINPNYHVPNRPFFDVIELKGGGDTTSAARAVLQTGEFDFAWNMQVEWDVLRRLEQGGKGKVLNTTTGNIEHVQLNQTDPWTEVDGERASVKTKHPIFHDLKFRQALALLVDRATVAEELYGPTGQATGNFLNAPARFRSRNTKWEFIVDKANRLLDEAGYRRGPDGVRLTKDGKRIKLLFQTSTNSLRQKNQAIVKQACAKGGIEVELKSVTASVFFSSDPANADTYSHFYADLQMYNTTMTSPDPQWFMNQFLSTEVAQKANKWAGRNPTRWRNEEYDKLWNAAEVEFDPLKRAAQFIQMNDLVVNNVVVIPENWRNRPAAVNLKLGGMELSGWDSDLWHIAYWHREA